MVTQTTHTTGIRMPMAFDRKTTVTLAGLGLALVGVTLAATAAFPRWSASRLSPVELSIWLTLFACALFALSQLRQRSSDTKLISRLSSTAVIAVMALQSADFASEWEWPLLTGKAADIIIAILAAGMAAYFVLRFTGELQGRRWLSAAFWSIVVFFGLAVMAEFIELRRPFTSYANGELQVTEFCELLAIELFLLGSILSAGRRAAAPAPLLAADPRELGTFARQTFSRLHLVREARHPPALIAFVPGVGDAIAVLSAVALLFYAGLPLRRATGIGLIHQFLDMLLLWRQHRIDPPSYYALDLYKPVNRARAGRYLTRYETKNGLLHVLNYELLPGPPKGELNDKRQFATLCRHAGIRCPQTLALVTAGHAELYEPQHALRQDLFCKPLRGMGAFGTHRYRYDKAADRYMNEQGKPVTQVRLLAELMSKAAGAPLLVQPWLENHPEIADLAETSLLVFRVITCLDAAGQPVVCLAMLRLLAKLEDRWHDLLPDGEYATPIDIESGILGAMTGDNLRTAERRYALHPANGLPVEGRTVANWQKVAATAIAVHRSLPGRAVIGWDIALTPQGAVVLEGNSNFDVMFLQRVIDRPLGETRLGSLLRPMIEALYHR